MESLKLVKQGPGGWTELDLCLERLGRLAGNNWSWFTKSFFFFSHTERGQIFRALLMNEWMEIHAWENVHSFPLAPAPYRAGLGWGWNVVVFLGGKNWLSLSLIHLISVPPFLASTMTVPWKRGRPPPTMITNHGAWAPALQGPAEWLQAAGRAAGLLPWGLAPFGSQPRSLGTATPPARGLSAPVCGTEQTQGSGEEASLRSGLALTWPYVCSGGTSWDVGG